MSRPRLIETEKFQRCRDRDSSRPGNLLDVDTETSRDWAKDVDTETPSRLLLISVKDSALKKATAKVIEDILPFVLVKNGL